MKTKLLYLLISSFIFFYFIPSSADAQEFSDFKIGDKLEGKDMVKMEVGGVDGVLFLYTNKKGIIRSLGFVPSKMGGTQPAKVYKGDFIRFKQFIEEHYEVGFERTLDLHNKKQHYSATYNGAKLVISIEEFEDDFKPVTMTFMMNKI